MAADMKVFEDFNLGQAIVKSLEQAVEFERGDKTKSRAIVREIPTPDYAAKDIVQVRDQYKLSQHSLALALNVSPAQLKHGKPEKISPPVLPSNFCI